MHSLVLLKKAFLASLVLLYWGIWGLIYNPIGWVILAIVIFCMMKLFKAENTHIKKRTSSSPYFFFNSLLRILYILLCFFCIPWGVLGSATSITARYNPFYYELNLVAVATFIPVVLILLLVTRRLEQLDKKKTAFIVLLIPLVNIMVSMVSMINM